MRECVASGMGKTAGNGTSAKADVAEAIVAASCDAIVTFDSGGRVVSLNPAAERLFGCPSADIVGAAIEKLIFGDRGTPPARDETQAETIWDRLASGQKPHECMGQTAQGTALDLELTVSKARTNGHALFVAIARDISARKQRDAQTRYLAHFDSLTGLPNRALFEERVNQALNQAKRNDAVLSLMMLDLDRFKAVNDSLGHQVGDKLLTGVARRLRETVRETDTVTRLGGDEFAVLLTNLHDVHGAGTVAEAIVKALSRPFDLDGERLVTSASIGITAYPGDGDDVELLLRNADRALYKAKAKGRNTYQFYVPEMDALVQANKTMERDLRQALEAGDLALEYQPLVSAETGEISGVEALVRWNDQSRGVIVANEFIPVVERSDLILRLGRWVMREACTQAKAWQDSGLPDLKLSINLSPAELHHRDLVAEVETVLTETGLDPKSLQLEFSEDAFLLAVRKNAKVLDRLREMGVSVSLDHFGSGTSSIEILRKHPVDRFKIDRAFLESLGGEKNGHALLGPLVQLAHGLGATVSVECVETLEHAEEARARGAEELQGHFLSEPVAAEQLAAMVRAGLRLQGTATSVKPEKE